MTPKLARKKPDRPDPEKWYLAIDAIAGDLRTVAIGDRLKGDDPMVSGNFRSFVDEERPPDERPNFWHLVNGPVPVPPHVIIPSAIEPHRQAMSVVDVFLPGSWAPDSPGAKSGVPPPFGGAIRRGQVFDILSPVVAQHPDWFEIPRRDLTAEDVERARRLED